MYATIRCRPPKTRRYSPVRSKRIASSSQPIRISQPFWLPKRRAAHHSSSFVTLTCSARKTISELCFQVFPCSNQNCSLAASRFSDLLVSVSESFPSLRRIKLSHAGRVPSPPPVNILKQRLQVRPDTPHNRVPRKHRIVRIQKLAKILLTKH